MFTEIDDLESRIDQLKEELIQTVKLTGLNSQDTLYCSQKLDELITICQKQLQNNSNFIPIFA